jgi:hypothetical protein
MTPAARGLPNLRDYLNSLSLGGDERELGALATLEAAGLAVAPTRVVPAEEEERFYRLNNLPERLNELFGDLELDDPDEDEVEEVAPEAERLIKTHYLLDEFIDLFYGALEEMPSRVVLRRPAQAQGFEAGKGRPALLALKNLWAAEWRFEALMARLHSSRSIALQARPALIQPAPSEEAPEAFRTQALELLGAEARLLGHPELGITHVLFG